MQKIKELLDKALLGFVSLLFVALVAFTVLQVILRYFFNAPLNFVDELARFFLVWIGLLGSSWVTGQKGHMAMDILMARLVKNESPNRYLLGTFINYIGIAFSAIILVAGGGRLAYNMSYQISPALRLSMGIVYAALPLSGLLNIFYLALDTARLYKTYGAQRQKGA